MNTHKYLGSLMNGILSVEETGVGYVDACAVQIWKTITKAIHKINDDVGNFGRQW